MKNYLKAKNKFFKTRVYHYMIINNNNNLNNSNKI